MPTRTAIQSADAAAPFIDGYLAYLLARASHLISAEFHVVVRRSRLPVLQWRVLATLADGQVSSIGEVAAIILVPQSTLTRVAARMVTRVCCCAPTTRRTGASRAFASAPRG